MVIMNPVHIILYFQVTQFKVPWSKNLTWLAHSASERFIFEIPIENIFKAEF